MFKRKKQKVTDAFGNDVSQEFLKFCHFFLLLLLSTFFSSSCLLSGLCFLGQRWFSFSQIRRKKRHIFLASLLWNALARALKKARILNAGCQILKFHRLTEWMTSANLQNHAKRVPLISRLHLFATSFSKQIIVKQKKVGVRN